MLTIITSFPFSTPLYIRPFLWHFSLALLSAIFLILKRTRSRLEVDDLTSS